MQKILASKCTNCGEVLDGATCAVGDDAPDPGDITICLYCGELMRFQDDLTLGPLTDADMHEVAGWPLLLKMQKLRALYLEEKKKKNETKENTNERGR